MAWNESQSAGAPATDQAWQMLLDHLPQCVGVYAPIRDGRGRIVDFRVEYVNQAACLDAGLASEQQVGRRLDELMPRHWRGGLFGVFCEVMDTGRPFVSERFECPGLSSARGPTLVAIDVRRHAENLLAVWSRPAELRFTRRLLNSLFTFVGLLDLDGTLLEANDAPLRAAGLTLEEVRGRKFWDCPWWSYDEEVQRRLKDACARAGLGETVRYEADVRTAGDQRVALDFQIAPLRDAGGCVTHLIPSAVDVAERKRIESALSESEAIFRATFQNAAVGMAHVAPDGRFLRVNDRLLEMTGYTRQEMHRLTFEDITEPDDVEADWRQARRLLAGEIESYAMEKRYIRKDGAELPIHLTVSLVRRHSGEPDHFISITEDISERKRAERALRESEERFRLAAAAAGLGAYDYDVERDQSVWSTQLRTLHDLERKDGLRLEDIRALVHPDDRARFDEIVRRALDPDGPGSHDVQYRMMSSDGRTRWVRDVGRTWFEGEGSHRRAVRIVGTLQDVTESREAEEALRLSEARFRAMADDLPLIIWLHNAEGRQEFVNATFCEYFGVTREQMRGDRWRPLMHPDDGSEYLRKFIACVRERRFFHAEVRVRNAHGEWRWLESWGRPRFDAEGEYLGHIGTSADVTERKEAEEALRRTHADLERRVAERTAELRQRAEQLGRLTSELTIAEQRERQRVARVLHDHVQQLLASARLGLGFISGGGDPRRTQWSGHVRECIDDAIAASRSLSVELSPPVLHESGLSAGLRWLARWMKEKHGLVVTLSLEPDADPLREDVRTLVFESVRELLFNVVKHAGSKEATLELAPHDERRLRVVVADRGRGFDPRAQFAHEEEAIRPGIGLVSIRERLTLLGGSFEIQSEPDNGARVTLIAPRDGATITESAAPVVTEAPARQRVATPSPPPPPVEGRIRVLIADDHAVMRDGLRALLAEEPDLEVVGEAGNGVEAVERARALLPEVILMDFSMPRLNGAEATRRIRAEMPHVQVIGLSMYEEHDRAQTMISAGAAAYMTKAGDADALIDRIREVSLR